jgi:hypothetical protein
MAIDAAERHVRFDCPAGGAALVRTCGSQPLGTFFASPPEANPIAGALVAGVGVGVAALALYVAAWRRVRRDRPDADRDPDPDPGPEDGPFAVLFAAPDSDDAVDDADDDWESIGSSDVAAAETVGVAGFDLEDPFTVEWVDVERKLVRVADRAHGATFRVVDRDRELVVEPNDGFDPETSPEEWFLDAADAIETALPDRVDALDDADVWPSADGVHVDALDDADVWPSADGVHVDPSVVDRFQCRVADRIGRGTVVEVAGDDRTATVVVDAGRGSFPSSIARAAHPAHWAVHAITAAEAYAKETLDPADVEDVEHAGD